MSNFESGLDALRALSVWDETQHGEDRNEASVRFHLIDVVLKEVLGWPSEEIHVERHGPAGFTDYEMGRPSVQLLVEAKRESVGFELPAGLGPRLKLSTLVRGAADVGEAVKQATGYCQARGVPLACVTNGRQFVFFMGSRQDGVAPQDGDCVVFDSLAGIDREFELFWKCGSHAGVSARQGISLLQASHVHPAPARLSQRLIEYPGFKNRNKVAAELQILGGAFVEDLAQHPDLEAVFMKEAYCTSGALSQYALVSREILQARYSGFFEREAGVTAERAAGKSGVSSEFVRDTLASSLSHRSIILLGDVGVGKTTFIRHFVSIDASDVLQEAIVLYVDFGREPALTDELRSYAQESFIRQLYDDYGIDIDDRNFVHAVYRSDLQRFEKGIYGDLLRAGDKSAYTLKEIEHLEQLVQRRDEHLRRSLDHIQKSQRRQIVVFLDNVDQRAAAFQDEVFLIAESLASSWPVTAFVALRPETFQRSKVAGALSGYQPRVFTIYPPRIDRVLQARLAYALKLLDSQGALPGFPAGVTIESDRLRAYLVMLAVALNENRQIIEFIDNMSGGSVRRAIEILMRFIGSGHVNNSKIFDILERDDHYWLPLHEFLRAVAYGDHEYFDPTTSLLVNIFDISSDDGTEHFLLPCLLASLESSGTSNEGFVSTATLYASLQGIGFLPVQIDAALERGLSGGLIETYPRVLDAADIREAVRLRLTSSGAYTFKRLPCEFSYIDSVIVDTPIVDGKFRELIVDAHAIGERLSRAETFVDYLSAEFEVLRQRAVEVPFDWPTVEVSLRHALAELDRRLPARRLPLN